jgi:hypothetical protein
LISAGGSRSRTSKSSLGSTKFVLGMRVSSSARRPTISTTPLPTSRAPSVTIEPMPGSTSLATPSTSGSTITTALATSLPARPAGSLRDHWQQFVPATPQADFREFWRNILALGTSDREKLEIAKARREFVWGYSAVTDPSDGKYKVYLYIGRVLSWKRPIAQTYSSKIVPDLRVDLYHRAAEWDVSTMREFMMPFNM